VVLLILAGIWAAVLVPWVRSRVEPGPADSIGDFRRQLGVLQRTGPVSVAPANRLRVPPYQPGVPTPYSTPFGQTRRATSPVASPLYQSGEAARRARTMKRRRDVFLTLLGGMAGTLVLGLLPPFRVLLVLHVVLDLAFAGYVALLVQMRNAKAEREMKLRFLPSPLTAEPAPVRVRSAN